MVVYPLFYITNEVLLIQLIIAFDIFSFNGKALQFRCNSRGINILRRSTPKSNTRVTCSSLSLWNYLGLIILVWTLFIGVLVAWTYSLQSHEALELATNEARSAFEKDILYRRWNSLHDGVYVPVTDDVQPNPYLKDPSRDLTTDSGMKLTKINPAYMTRQVHELGALGNGVQGHITSLDPIRPENRPDPWEKKALERIDQGEKEVAEVLDFKDTMHLRLMRPLITEEGCLQCHAEQGYQVGDIRGGISISVPMKPYNILGAQAKKQIAAVFGLVWLVGLGSISWFASRADKYLRQRDKTEQSLIQNERKLQSILHTVPLGLGFFKNCRLEWVNPAFLDLFGYTEEEVLGRDALFLHLDREHYEAMKDDFYSKLRPGECHEMEIRLKKKNGEILDCLVRGYSQDGAQTTDGVMIALLDLTQRKMTEQVKRDLEKEVFSAQKFESLAMMAGGIAHDFNNLLFLILGNLSMARMEKEDAAALAEYLKDAETAAKRAESLTQQMLHFSGRGQQEVRLTSLPGIVPDSRGILEAGLPEGIHLEFEVAPDTPEILADRHQVQQLLVHLVANAAEALQDSGGTILIRAGQTRIGEESGEFHICEPGFFQEGTPGVFLEVIDGGIGIDSLIIERMFEPFFSTRFTGRGLGLAAVLGIAQGHKARIAVKSEMGQGTVFRIIFPVGEEMMLQALDNSHEKMNMQD